MYLHAMRIPGRNFIFLMLAFCGFYCNGFAQTNLLLNGGFDDINTCKEYSAECGVEAWFYLKDVKVQMIGNEPGVEARGANTFSLFYNWSGYKKFTPVIGTILPCSLQKGKQYFFKGWIAAKLSPKLLLKPGVCISQNFYVPQRPFSKEMKPDSIVALTPVKGTAFHEFSYSFIANGNETYLTFGTFIMPDTLHAKKPFAGAESISLMLDNFSLTSIDPQEVVCAAYSLNKQTIYQYDFRHKEMDYTLYGKGKLPVNFPATNEDNLTKLSVPVKAPMLPDTLLLGDVLFDFNKAELKTAAVIRLETFFKQSSNGQEIDSVYIEGHTDSLGSDQRNLKLSEQRSEAVMRWFITNQILTTDKITLHPFGRSRPVASNRNPAERALNRRVEIIVFRRGD